MGGEHAGHLPFFLTGWDDHAKKTLYAGHFGFVDAAGNGVSGYPSFKSQYKDAEPAWHSGDSWPSDVIRGVALPRRMSTRCPAPYRWPRCSRRTTVDSSFCAATVPSHDSGGDRSSRW